MVISRAGQKKNPRVHCHTHLPFSPQSAHLQRTADSSIEAIFWCVSEMCQFLTTSSFPHFHQWEPTCSLAAGRFQLGPLLRTCGLFARHANFFVLLRQPLRGALAAFPVRFGCGCEEWPTLSSKYPTDIISYVSFTCLALQRKVFWHRKWKGNKCTRDEREARWSNHPTTYWLHPVLMTAGLKPMAARCSKYKLLPAVKTPRSPSLFPFLIQIFVFQTPSIPARF